MDIKQPEKITLVPTSSMSFDKQVLILRAYVILSENGTKAVHYKKVMSATRLARTQISGVNEFFVSLGFIKRIEKGTYLPTIDLSNFYNKLPGEEDYLSLQKLIEQSELYSSVKGLIQIHGSVTEDEVIEYLLDVSGETTKSRAKRSLKWLEKTKLIEIADDERVVLQHLTDVH